MSATDARAADEFLRNAPTREPTAAERRQQLRDDRERLLRRMADAIANTFTFGGSVTARDLLSHGFTQAEIDRHYLTALSRSGIKRMAA